MDVSQYIENIDSPLREIVEVLRQTVKETSMEFKEEMKWNVPTYSINKNVCSITAHTHHVNLQLFKGAALEGASKLEGTGKDMRHLKYAALREVKVAEIKKYLKQAVALDA
jgi:hypothetical protein